jgi:hypothetical protein
MSSRADVVAELVALGLAAAERCCTRARAHTPPAAKHGDAHLLPTRARAQRAGQRGGSRRRDPLTLCPVRRPRAGIKKDLAKKAADATQVRAAFAVGALRHV